MPKLWCALFLLLVSINSSANMGCSPRGYFDFYRSCNSLIPVVLDLMVLFGGIGIVVFLIVWFLHRDKSADVEAPSHNQTEERLNPLDRLINLRGTTGGLYKRIDENREIMNLIYTEAPQLVSKNPWLVGWLNANDDFYTQLAQINPPRGEPQRCIYPVRPEPKL